MDSVNKTLYIPLYGKAYVSVRGLFLKDKKAEEIWQAEGFALKGKSASKWLAFYMGIRSAVFDRWTEEKMAEMPDAAVIHIGCGLDSRILRVGAAGHRWYDVDFPAVIDERKRYYAGSDNYRMIPGDARDSGWLENISGSSAVVIMEGVSMYLTPEELQRLTAALCGRFERVALLMDCYTVLAARMSKRRNPVSEVGVTEVYGMDDPGLIAGEGLTLLKEHAMTPQEYIDRLTGMERFIFQKLYAGSFSRKLYRLFEYKK